MYYYRTIENVHRTFSLRKPLRKRELATACRIWRHVARSIERRRVSAQAVQSCEQLAVTACSLLVDARNRTCSTSNPHRATARQRSGSVELRASCGFCMRMTRADSAIETRATDGDCLRVTRADSAIERRARAPKSACIKLSESHLNLWCTML